MDFESINELLVPMKLIVKNWGIKHLDLSKGFEFKQCQKYKGINFEFIGKQNENSEEKGYSYLIKIKNENFSNFNCDNYKLGEVLHEMNDGVDTRIPTSSDVIPVNFEEIEEKIEKLVKYLSYNISMQDVNFFYGTPSFEIGYKEFERLNQRTMIHEELKVFSKQINKDFISLNDFITIYEKNNFFKFIIDTYDRSLKSFSFIDKYANLFFIIEKLESDNKEISEKLLNSKVTKEIKNEIKLSVSYNKEVFNKNTQTVIAKNIFDCEEDFVEVFNKKISNFGSKTVLNRAGKLVKILSEKYQIQDITVDLTESLINLRNILFHGKDFEKDNKEKLEKNIPILHNIIKEIINYELKQCSKKSSKK